MLNRQASHFTCGSTAAATEGIALAPKVPQLLGRRSAVSCLVIQPRAVSLCPESACGSSWRFRVMSTARDRRSERPSGPIAPKGATKKPHPPPPPPRPRPAAAPTKVVSGRPVEEGQRRLRRPQQWGPWHARAPAADRQTYGVTPGARRGADRRAASHLGVCGVHSGCRGVPGPISLDPEGSVGRRGVVRDPVHGVPLAIGLCHMEGAGSLQRGVLDGIRDSRARGADDVSHNFPAVLPIHVEENHGTIRGDHAVGPAGNVRQLSAGAFLLGVIAQLRTAPDGELLRAQREASVVVALVAPLRRFERCPHLRDELHEEGPQGGLGPFLGGCAALRHDWVLPCSGDVLDRPVRHPHAIH